ncbi:regulatory protein YcgZ [Rahnella selenatireducens]|uniref:regulatory protein YcgZ n=1 Tax=Rahnella selenatireducens TaxID=3389797 RepID=UPI0039686759
MPHRKQAITLSGSTFLQAYLPSDEEAMGRIVVELLTAGKNLNRKNLCAKLLILVETASSADEERQYMQLIRLVLERDS